MVKLIMEHWLTISAGFFILFMVLYGHYRGFLRIALTMFALVISMLSARFAAPYAAAYLKENTPLCAVVQETFIKAVDSEHLLEDGFVQSQLLERQKQMIEEMKLPKQVKKVLLENNNSDRYHRLGVDTFLDYVGTYLADMVLNLASSIVLFIFVYLALRVLMHTLDLVARLPVISGINQIAGALVGFIQSLLWIWAFFLIVDFFGDAAWAQYVTEQIEQSVWLDFLYKNNLFNWLALELLESVFRA